MKDSRFTSLCEDATELVDGLDVDELDDLETMLMFLLKRPVTVVQEDEDSILVTVWSDAVGFGCLTEFPTTVAELAVCAAESAVEAGPHEGRADSVQAGSDVLAMSEDELVPALQHALGMVRVFNTLDDA